MVVDIPENVVQAGVILHFLHFLRIIAVLGLFIGTSETRISPI